MKELPEELFNNISPLDHRYASTPLARKLRKYFAEEVRVRYQARVEQALVATWEELGNAPAGSGDEVARAVQGLRAADVYKAEQVTRHDIRALVRVLQEKVPPEVRPFIHLGVTSYDIVDTAHSLQLREAVLELVLPLLKELLAAWLELAWREKDTVQVGRTHGQHAVPTTFGYLMLLYCQRLSTEINKLKGCVEKLQGKVAGPVGAYNGISLLYPEPEEFEKMVLDKVGLKPAPVSSQIIPGEDILHLFHHQVAVLGIMADFSDDMRHLQRTEIGEVGEEFAAGQVGSSTMPQKQNPINFENVKSIWKSFLPRILTIYMDQLSEHQRDLSNSASGRFYHELAAGLVLNAERLLKVSRRLQVNKQAMERNLHLSDGYIMAEAAYLLLAKNGRGDAHE
ncbi:MAG: lyase family protein, partial [Halanaerobium sp.]|nr:lyase family protein [Halanaerobium sp.]